MNLSGVNSIEILRVANGFIVASPKVYNVACDTFQPGSWHVFNTWASTSAFIEKTFATKGTK